MRLVMCVVVCVACVLCLCDGLLCLYVSPYSSVVEHSLRKRKVGSSNLPGGSSFISHTSCISVASPFGRCVIVTCSLLSFRFWSHSPLCANNTVCALWFNVCFWFWKQRPVQALIGVTTGVLVGTTSVVIRKNWNDTEKISMAPAQG